MKVALQWLSNNALESYRPVFPKFIEFFPAPPPQKKKNTKPCEPCGHSSCASRDCCRCTYRPLSVRCEFMKHVLICWCGTDGNEIIYQHFFLPLFPYAWRHRPVHYIWRSVCILQVKSLPASLVPFTHPLSLSLSLSLSALYCLLHTVLRTPISFSSFVLSATDFRGD